MKSDKQTTRLQSLYCSQMEEIKTRSALIRELLAGNKSLGSQSYDYEVFALNMRKILELIAFSSLIANKEKYAAAHKNFDRHYKAKGILSDMEEIHAGFYPVAADIEKQSDGIHHLKNTSTNALTKDEFEEIYDKCAKLLHVWNPFVSTPRVVDFRLSPIEWLDKTRDLLNTHYVQLVDGAGYWLCFMKEPVSKKVHVYTLKPVESQSTSSEDTIPKKSP